MVDIAASTRRKLMIDSVSLWGSVYSAAQAVPEPDTANLASSDPKTLREPTGCSPG